MDDDIRGSLHTFSRWIEDNHPAWLQSLGQNALSVCDEPAVRAGKQDACLKSNRRANEGLECDS
jgi:hypothetical protein